MFRAVDGGTVSEDVRVQAPHQLWYASPQTKVLKTDDLQAAVEYSPLYIAYPPAAVAPAVHMVPDPGTAAPANLVGSYLRHTSLYNFN